MSTEQEDTERMPLEPIFLHFKRFKVAISQAIKRPFPFLAFLRDTELISDKMYKDFQDSCTNLVPVEQVVYRALEELEKRLDEVVLRVLFSEENMRAYPELEDIITNLENVSQNRLCSQGSDRGDPNPQLNHEQVLSLPENELSEDPLETVQINQVRRDTTCDNTDELERDQATPGAEPEESCVPEVQLSNSDAPMESHSPLFWNEENIQQENSSFVLDDEETEASTSHNEASEVIDLSIEDSDEGNNHSEESTSGICKSRAELLIQGPQINPCYVHLVDIMKENSSFVSDSEESEEASTSHNEGSEVMDHSSEDSDDGMNYVEESTSGICKPSPRNPRQHNVDFSSPDLPVTCGIAKGTLYKEKFVQGTSEKSILSETGEWLTLREFEIKGKRENSRKWKQSIRCYGWTLKELIEDGHLPYPPRKRRKNRRSDNLGVTVESQFEMTFERTLSINNTGEQLQSHNNHIVLLT